ncbi:hypothetical protein [Halalkalicoccus paucihalophilus]|nr:hypothetical protein [Halalkalicoccus paucihalophilus]
MTEPEDHTEGEEGATTTNTSGSTASVTPHTQTNASEKLDALDRYERMIDVQIQTLNDIDNKAEYLTRYLAILIALLFTGASFVLDVGVADGFVSELSLFTTLVLGLLALTVSVVFSIITYLSSVFQYGPRREFAEDIADHDIGEKLYAEIMLRTYSDAIYQNKRVVRQNSARFKYALTGLLNGVLFLAILLTSLGIVIQVLVEQ